MKENNVLLTKTYSYALKIIELYLHLVKVEKEYILSKQLLKSGTSIGANAEEAIGAQSRKDFKSKLSIAYKEARESHYWLRLLKDSGVVNESQVKALLIDCHEIMKILGSIVKTLKYHDS